MLIALIPPAHSPNPRKKEPLTRVEVERLNAILEARAREKRIERVMVTIVIVLFVTLLTVLLVSH